MFRSAEFLFKPKTVAIVGASETGGNGWPRVLFENLGQGRSPARVFLVNPRRDRLWDEPVFPDLASLPEPADLALTIVPSPAIPDILAVGVEHGLKAAMISAAQFGEDGDPAGVALAASLKSLCDERGLRITGPNCTGALALPQGLRLYPHPAVRDLPRGELGVVFQSGGAFLEWVQQAGRRGLGVSYTVCSGNELDLDLADYLNFMVEDGDTTYMACFVEGIRNPERFLEVARKALAAGKPILMLKLGRSEGAQAAAASHTGALTGDDRVFDAMCERYGVIRCKTLDDLIETALAFGPRRFPTGSRIGMPLTSGGVKGLCLDHADEEGMSFPKLAPETLATLEALVDPGMTPDNPLDAGGSLNAALQPDRYAAVAGALMADPNVDVLAVQGLLPQAAGGRVTPDMFRRLAEATGKPVIAFGRTGANVNDFARAFQAEARIPFLQGIPETLRAIQALGRYGRAQARGIAEIPPPAGAEADLDGETFAETLAERGLTPPKSAFVADAEAAGPAAEDLGFPLALKLVSPDAVHKTEVGGVTLNIRSAAEAVDAARAMAAKLLAIHPDASVEGFLLQEMVSGLELIVGARQDPQYGPIVAVGVGGVFVEVFKDVAVRMAPVTEAEAREMLDSLRGRVLLDSFRGAPPRDVDAVVRAIVGLSQTFLDYRPWLSDLEVNPLMVGFEGEGARAVDIRPIRRA